MGGDWNWTADPLISGPTAQPPEPQPVCIFIYQYTVIVIDENLVGNSPCSDRERMFVTYSVNKDGPHCGIYTSLVTVLLKWVIKRSVIQPSHSDSVTSSWLFLEKFCKRVSWRSWKASWVLHIYLDYRGLFICFIYPTFCVLHLNLFVLASASSDLAAALIYLNKVCWGCSTKLRSGPLKHLNTALSVGARCLPQLVLIPLHRLPVWFVLDLHSGTAKGMESQRRRVCNRCTKNQRQCSCRK